MFKDEQGKVLLRLARAAIAERFDMPGVTIPHEAWQDEPGATFVTLTQHGQLRGCIGSLEAHRPLAEDVRHNAIAAAFRDPRFAPLSVDELEKTAFEVSLLSPAHSIIFNSEADAVTQLRPGIDGVILEHGWHKGTFLPQVWEQLSDPVIFMSHLKNKAGLPENFWSDEIKLSRYTVQKWREEDSHG
jgi:AmmeMemoRadiSam system protein A